MTEEGVLVGDGSKDVEGWQKPLAAMKGVWTVKAALQALMFIWLFGWMAIMFDAMSGGFCITGTVILISVLAVIIARAWAGYYYDVYRYRITDSEIAVESGVLFFKKTIIPLRRIQNVNVVQGPIMRAYGVKSILIETAGGVVYQQGASGANLAEGQLVAPPDADALADDIMKKVHNIRIGGDV